MAAEASAACRAAAKVNLYLDVLGPRADGYHELETLFLEVPWGDGVRVTVDPEPARSGRCDVTLDVRGPVAAPGGEDNLAIRAARRFLDADAGDAGPPPRRVRVELEKHVPVGAGLGGGSADAAAVLRLLGDLLPGRVAAPILRTLAAALGADVPFFLQGGAAVGRARGEDLASLGPLMAPPLLLILPPFGCSTAAVFGAFERVRGAPPHGLEAAVQALRARDPARMRAAHYNALAFAALKVHPRLRAFTADVERRLGRAPAMSGSGSALFDVPDVGEMDAVRARLEGLAGVRVVAGD